MDIAEIIWSSHGQFPSWLAAGAPRTRWLIAPQREYGGAIMEIAELKW